MLRREATPLYVLNLTILRKRFIAGLIDAEAGTDCCRRRVRVYNSNGELLSEIENSLQLDISASLYKEDVWILEIRKLPQTS